MLRDSTKLKGIYVIGLLLYQEEIDLSRNFGSNLKFRYKVHSWVFPNKGT